MSAEKTGKIPVPKEITNAGKKMTVTYWIKPVSADHQAIQKTLLDPSLTQGQKAAATKVPLPFVKQFEQAHKLGDVNQWASAKKETVAAAAAKLTPEPAPPPQPVDAVAAAHAVIDAAKKTGGKVTILKNNVKYHVVPKTALEHVHAGGKLAAQQPKSGAPAAEPSPDSFKPAAGLPMMFASELPATGLPGEHKDTSHWKNSVIPNAAKAGEYVVIKLPGAGLAKVLPTAALDYVNAGGHLASLKEAEAATGKKLKAEPPKPAPPPPKPKKAPQTDEQKEAKTVLPNGSKAVLDEHGIPVQPSATPAPELFAHEPHVKAAIAIVRARLGTPEGKAALAALKASDGKALTQEQFDFFDRVRQDAMPTDELRQLDREVITAWSGSAMNNQSKAAKQAVAQTGLTFKETGGNTKSNMGSSEHNKVVQLRSAISQEILRQSGITHLHVFRGIAGSQGSELHSEHPEMTAGHIVNDAKQWELSCWSTDAKTAKKFAGAIGVVVEMKIPIDHVYASWHTDRKLATYSGMHLGEHEVIVARRNGTPPVRVYNDHQK